MAEMSTVIDNSKPRDSKYSKWLDYLPSVGAMVGIILLWEIGQRLSGFPPKYIVPLPSSIVKYLADEWLFLLHHLSITLAEAGIGFIIGNIFAIALAVGCVFSAQLKRVIMPFALALRSIPIIAITPVLVFMLGVGWLPKLAVAALVTFFPTLVNMVVGLTSVDYRMLELMHVLNANKMQILMRIRYPSSIPSLFAALKIAVPSAILGAAIAEWINASAGIGYLIIISTYQFKTEMLYATMVVTTAITAAAYLLIIWLEGLIVPWQKHTRS
jgi:NitT/TauT family transport system permease protein